MYRVNDVVFSDHGIDGIANPRPVARISFLGIGGRGGGGEGGLPQETEPTIFVGMKDQVSSEDRSVLEGPKAFSLLSPPQMIPGVFQGGGGVGMGEEVESNENSGGSGKRMVSRRILSLSFSFEASVEEGGLPREILKFEVLKLLERH